MFLDVLSEYVFFPGLERWQGRRVAQYRTEVRQVLDSKWDRVRDFQWRRVRAICQHAYENSAFYRKRFQDMGIAGFDRFGWEEFRLIPPLTKEDVREHISSLVSQRHRLSTLRKSATGGTTASPTTIYLDGPAYDRRWAATYEWDRRIGMVRGRKVAYLWGASQDFDVSPSWRQRLLNFLVWRARYLASSPLDDEIMTGFHRTLQKWKPTFLQAYPTPLAIFSEFLLRNKLTLNIPGISVTAEPLQASHAELITRAFGRRPFNWYGAREVGRIATECHLHCGMHVNAYGMHVEVDQSGGGFFRGLGRIFITDLWNLGMPLIRYEIGDVGELTTERCACGSELPRLTKLEGRTADMFLNSKGQRISGVALTNRIVTENSEIREMQVVQTAIGRFDVLVVAGERWQGERSEEQIKNKLGEFIQEPTVTNVSLVESIPREASGKVRFCKSFV